MEFEFNFGRRHETIGERRAREDAEAARRRTAGLLNALFGGVATAVPTEVPVIIRTTVEADSVLGTERTERTKSAIITIKPGMKLGKIEDEATIFGRTVTTVVIEGLEGYKIPTTTETSEVSTVFGTTYTTEVKVMSEIEQQLNQAHRQQRDDRNERSERRSERVIFTVRRTPRPGR